MRATSFAASLVKLVPLFFLAQASCSSSDTPSDSSSSSSTDTRSVTQTIGPEGGSIDVDGATVTFPKGALAEPKSITIRSTAAVPEGFVALSKVFECEPSGTDFAQPVTMRMPFTDDGKGPVTMFWSTGGDPTFKDIGGTPEGKVMTATVLHFSSGLVGRKK
jgi:ZU5 domain-containing protein